MPLRTMARIAALRPGQSPPPVSTPTRTAPRYLEAPTDRACRSRLANQRRATRAEEAERGTRLIAGRKQVRVAQLGAPEPGRIPQLALDLGSPWPHVHVWLGVLLVPRRDAVVGPLACGIGTRLEGDVEVLGPEVRLRSIVCDRQPGLERLQQLGGEGIKFRQPSGRHRIDAEGTGVGGDAVGEQARS